MWCGAVWCGVVRCGLVRFGAVWCGVVRCGVVWCGGVWCGARARYLPLRALQRHPPLPSPQDDDVYARTDALDALRGSPTDMHSPLPPPAPGSGLAELEDALDQEDKAKTREEGEAEDDAKYV